MYDFNIIAKKTEEKSVKYNKTQLFFGREDLLPLWVADMDFPIGPFIEEDIKKTINNHSLGYMYKGKEYFYSIINWQKNRYNLEIEKSHIIASHGVVFSIALIISLFSKEKDKIIVQTPVYSPFFKKIKALNREVVYNPLILEENKYNMNFSQLEKVIKGGKILIICNPHNPVGRVWTKEELENLNFICKKHGVLVVSDEIHGDMSLFDNKQISYLSIDQDAIILNSPAKAFNLASLNHSYILVKNSSYRRKIEVELLKMSLSEVNSIGVTALISAYTKGDFWLNECKSYIEENYLFVKEFIELNIPKIKLYDFQGTYLLWLNFKEFNLEQKELMNILINDAKVALNNGSDFGVEGAGHLRLNLATNRETIKECLNRIYQVFSKL